MPIKILGLCQVAQNWSPKESPSLVWEAFCLSFGCVPVGFELKELAFLLVHFIWNSPEFQTKLNETDLGQYPSTKCRILEEKGQFICK